MQTLNFICFLPAGLKTWFFHLLSMGVEEWVRRGEIHSDAVQIAILYNTASCDMTLVILGQRFETLSAQDNLPRKLKNVQPRLPKL